MDGIRLTPSTRASSTPMKRNPTHAAPSDGFIGVGCGGALARVVTGARTAAAASSDFESMWRDHGMTLKDMAGFRVPQAS